MSKKKTKKKLSSQNNTQAKRGKKKIAFIIITGIALVVGGIFSYDLINKSSAAEKSKVRQAVSQSDPSLLRGGESRPTLSPAMLQGPMKLQNKIPCCWTACIVIAIAKNPLDTKAF